MSADLARLAFLVVAGAALPVVHAAVAVRLARSERLSPPWRLAAVVPPLTLLAAWRARAALAATVWLLAAGAYALAWALSW